MKFIEQTRDLFQVSEEYVKAQCISADAEMGMGIAVTFVQQYPGIREFCKTRNEEVNNQIGDVILFGNVYNLVTKKYFNNRPSHHALKLALVNLREAMIKRKQYKLAIPQLGCGHDHLVWSTVKSMIMEVFRHTDIEIIACIYFRK